jgi:LMBR1 domain-containing protein 1
VILIVVMERSDRIDDEHVLTCTKLSNCLTMKDVLVLWVAFFILLGLATVGFIHVLYALSDRHEKSILTLLTVLLGLTVCASAILLPSLDVALASLGNIRSLGFANEGINMARVQWWVSFAYILTYSLMGFILLVAVPFSYVFFEEWDEESTVGSQALTALKYTAILITLVAIIFGLGIVIPNAKQVRGPKDGADWDYLGRLLSVARPIRGLLFVLGLMILLGTIALIYYGGTGLATLPVNLVKPSASQLEATVNVDDAQVNLDLNRQQQRAIEVRAGEEPASETSLRTRMNKTDRKQLDALQRRERALVRQIRLQREGSSVRKLFSRRIARPLQVFMGLIGLVLSGGFVTILLLTLLRELISSGACGPRCGVLRDLPGSLFFNPWNALLQATPAFVAFLFSSLLGLYLLMTLLNGIASLGIRFIWVSLFPVCAHGTVPQALLLMVVIALAGVLGLQWPVLNFIQPGYATFGSQTFCNATTKALCEQDASLVLPCSAAYHVKPGNITLLGHHDFSRSACHRSIVSNVVGALLANNPWFGVLLYWAEYALVPVFLIALVTAFVKRPAPVEADDEEVGEQTALLR